jgi:hypothetical protein
MHELRLELIRRASLLPEPISNPPNLVIPLEERPPDPDDSTCSMIRRSSAEWITRGTGNSERSAR